MSRYSINVKKRGRRGKKEKGKEDKIRNKGQNGILFCKRDVKGKWVSLEVNRVVDQKFGKPLGGRAKGQARLGFGEKDRILK